MSEEARKAAVESAKENELIGVKAALEGNDG